ncbi:hypothetical protein N7523_003953 [Penicillium sp. IBT 18751x]|nr:hypothetical protein N7523_003953 [Penicillium sp. IBT 18751x]
MEVSDLPRASTFPAIADETKFAPPRSSTLPAPVDLNAAPESSNSDGQRNSYRSAPIGGPLVKNSTHETRTEASAIDPLSQHIIQRTNTHKSIPTKLLGQASFEAEAGNSEGPSDHSTARGDASLTSKGKEKKKGVSFLSRIIGTKKKDVPTAVEDELSDAETSRMSIDTSHPIGFIPRYPAPPRYLRIRVHHKKDKKFHRVFLAQTLEGTGPMPKAERRTSSSTHNNGESTGRAIWAVEFSKDGKFLAAAGQDRKVRVWAIITTPDEREAAMRNIKDAATEHQDVPELKAPVFGPKPIQVFEGHEGSILDLSWSKNNFLLSSSMDKTVRLWHASRPECLCCFQHSDFVTSIQFHPKDDRFFLAGSLDTKLRLWSIPDKSVAYVTSVPDMITAVSFTPDGKYSMAGCLNGLLNIYDTEGLKVSGQIHVRSARGRNSKGNKITGIDTMTMPHDIHGDIKLLVTTNDSRIRLYNFHDRTLQAKFRGNENTCSQIRATFTDDGKHVICGSEDRKAYVWPIGSVEKDGDARAVEVFETQGAIVTVAITAPTSTKQALGLSDDPIYDICNPPPVALMSPEASAKPADSSRDTGSLHKRTQSAPRLSMVSKMAQESPSYLSRSTHPDGNIIVIADYSGKIKILRQDCAYQKRKHENWHESSTFSRRILRRSNSGRRSVASSTGKESTLKTPSERIISWRNSVVRHGRPSMDSSRAGLRSRSPSPHRQTPTIRLSSSRPSSLAPNESLSAFTSPPSSPKRPFAYPNISEQSEEQLREQEARIVPGRDADPRQLPASSADIVTSGKSKENPLWLQGDHSYAFWNKITHDAMAIKQRNANDLLNPNSILERRLSATGSVLSSDYGSSTGGSAEEDILKCENCRGTNFRGVKGRDGKQKLICVQCDRTVA